MVVNWDIFWSAASAIATTAAVLVALWQTKYPNLKKIKLEYCDSMTLIPNNLVGVDMRKHFTVIKVINVGNRKVRLERLYFKLPSKNEALIFPISAPIVTKPFPFELDVEESNLIPCDRNNIINFLSKENNWPKNKKITFYLEDSAGKVYKCKSPKTLGYYINECMKETK